MVVLWARRLFAGTGAERAINAGTPGSEDLEQAGCAHAATDAHRDDAVPGATTLPLDEEMAGAAGSGHAVRVADRDRPAGHVEPVVGDAERVAAVEDLAGERLVQLPDADVVDGETEPLEQLRHGEHRADAHLLRI